MNLGKVLINMHVLVLFLQFMPKSEIISPKKLTFVFAGSISANLSTAKVDL